METRDLILSDFSTEKEQAIINDPYSFLNLPPGAPIDLVRSSYIRLAKMYFPDMVKARFLKNPKSVFNPDELNKIGLPQSLDLEAILKNTNPQDGMTRDQALAKVQELAHKNMVILNRAYQEIKRKYSANEWNVVAGYVFDPVFNDKENHNTQRINLEGQGELTIYDYHFEYWAAGPYLQFDYDIDHSHPWYDPDFQGAIHLKHLFAHLELKRGHDINPILLDSFYDCFNLDAQNAEKYRQLLRSGMDTKDIMREMGLDSSIGYEDNRDPWMYNLHFRRHTNEILTLSTEPTWGNRTSIEFKDGGMIIHRQKESIFPEPDYVLFLTLAYGTLLK